MMRPIAGLACTVLVVACGTQTSDPDAAGAAPDDGWRAVAESLSPRDMAVAVSLGDRVLVVGGSDASPCPPNADCAVPDAEPLRDGAIYDPAADSWTPIADAPVPFGGFAGHVSGTGVIGEVAYFLLPSGADGPPALLSYDVKADVWDELPPPPLESWPTLVAVGDELVAYLPSHESFGAESIVPTDPLPPDVVYDPATGTWGELPSDPNRPSFDRKMIATDAGLVLLAKDLVPQPGADPPIVRAAVLDAANLAAGEWSALPDGEILYTDGFGWTGGLLVNPDQGSADGGETNNWGRSYPAGGILDPATGNWSDLPEGPPEVADPSPGELPIELFSSGSRAAVYGQWALDVPERAWLLVPQSAVDGDGETVELPQTGYGAAWVETPSGGFAFIWGGARWPEWDPSGSGTAAGELTADGFLWPEPTG